MLQQTFTSKDIERSFLRNAINIGTKKLTSLQPLETTSMKQHSRSTHQRIDEDQGSTDSCKMTENFRQLTVVDVQVRLLQKIAQAIAAELASAESQAANIPPTRM